MKVLSVEDSDFDFQLIEMTLRLCSEPIEILRVCDGEGAVGFLKGTGESIDRPRPDLILLDVNMPGMGGFGVLEFIQSEESFSDLPVLVLTSSFNTNDRKRALALGAQDYITKPIDLDEMVGVLSNVCSKYLLTSPITASGESARVLN